MSRIARSGDPDALSTASIRIAVTAAEKEAVEAAATAAGLSVSEHCRRLVLPKPAGGLFSKEVQPLPVFTLHAVDIARRRDVGWVWPWLEPKSPYENNGPSVATALHVVYPVARPGLEAGICRIHVTPTDVPSTTGRRRYQVFCTTCRALLHVATTSVPAQIEPHVADMLPGDDDARS